MIGYVLLGVGLLLLAASRVGFSGRWELTVVGLVLVAVAIVVLDSDAAAR